MYDTRRRLGSHPRLILGHPFCGFATRQNRNPNCSWKFHRHHGLNKLLSWRIVYYLLCFNILGSFTLRLYFFFSSTNPSPFFIKWIKNRISATRTFLLMNPAAFHAYSDSIVVQWKRFEVNRRATPQVLPTRDGMTSFGWSTHCVAKISYDESYRRTWDVPELKIPFRPISL